MTDACYERVGRLHLFHYTKGYQEIEHIAKKFAAFMLHELVAVKLIASTYINIVLKLLNKSLHVYEASSDLRRYAYVRQAYP